MFTRLFYMFARFMMIAVLAFISASDAAVAADRGVLLPIKEFVAAANSGDRARLVAAFESDSAIVDEFAPFRFPAPHAAAHWFDGFGADLQVNGVSGATIVVRPPKFLTVVKQHAYIVVPTVYTYQVHGKPAEETGSLAFTLVQHGKQWKIGTMSWAKLTATSQP